jgi:hypothetical protein
VPRTLLIGSPATSWRSWLKENRGGHDLLLLDPADPDHGHLGRVALFKGDKPVLTRFYGSLDPSRAPHVLVAALAELLTEAEGDVIVQLFPLHGGPLLRQTIVLMAQMVLPEDILVPHNATFDLNGFPVGPNELELEAAFPDTVRHAQRKANWLKLIERCTEHKVDLNRINVDGARLGSGRVIKREQLAKVGITEVFHAEVSGGSLLLIAHEEPPEQSLARALDVFHCGRIHVVHPESYDNLLCSFARESGEDFGTGVIQRIDFETKIAHILCDAVEPAPVRILKIGGIRIDTSGRELGEVRPWHV